MVYGKSNAEITHTESDLNSLSPLNAPPQNSDEGVIVAKRARRPRARLGAESHHPRDRLRTCIPLLAILAFSPRQETSSSGTIFRNSSLTMILWPRRTRHR